MQVPKTTSKASKQLRMKPFSTGEQDAAYDTGYTMKKQEKGKEPALGKEVRDETETEQERGMFDPACNGDLEEKVIQRDTSVGNVVCFKPRWMTCMLHVLAI